MVWATGAGAGAACGAALGGGIVDSEGRLRSPASVATNGTAMHDPLNDSLEAYMNNLSAGAHLQQGAGRPESSRCVLLENLITPEQAADPQEAHMTRMETGNECSKWGELLRVHVPCSAGADPDGPPVGGLGRVFVEFETQESAEECARAMDGRFFDGRRVGASYYPVESFLAERLDEDGVPLKQNAITWEDIVAMNSRPASQWDTMNTADEPGGSTSQPYATETDAEMSDAPKEDDEGEGEGDEDFFHQQFMAAMRAQAAETARQQARAGQQLMESGDDAMEALVEEFPDIESSVQQKDEDADSEDDMVV